MPLRDQVRPLLHSLVGSDPIHTPTQRQPNWVVGLDASQVYVHTEKSRTNKTEAQAVPIEWLLEIADLLEQRGAITRENLRRIKPRFRSAFAFAVLCKLKRVRCAGRPMMLTLVK